MKRTRERNVAVVRVLSDRTTEAEGTQVLTALQTLGVRYMRAVGGGAWWFPGRHTDDVCAFLEERGVRIEATL